MRRITETEPSNGTEVIMHWEKKIEQLAASNKSGTVEEFRLAVNNARKCIPEKYRRQLLSLKLQGTFVYSPILPVLAKKLSALGLISLSKTHSCLTTAGHFALLVNEEIDLDVILEQN